MKREENEQGLSGEYRDISTRKEDTGNKEVQRKKTAEIKDLLIRKIIYKKKGKDYHFGILCV